MRFEPLERYTKSLEEGYKLLPFLFTALDDKRYVLTNQAGQYAILDRPTLDDFVRHHLPADKSEYSTLKSRHFLLDSDSSVALDLLALKVRTKNALLPTSPRCIFSLSRFAASIAVRTVKYHGKTMTSQRLTCRKRRQTRLLRSSLSLRPP